MPNTTITDRFVSAQDGLRLHLRDYTPAGHDPDRNGRVAEKWKPIFDKACPREGGDHAQKDTAALPVLCLPGLTRTAADFEVLAAALSGDAMRPHRVLAMDSRGRGLSDRDPDPANYAVPVEARDVLTAMDALGLPRAVVIGSSRGGLVALTLAAMRPALLAGVIFNDIGPVIEMAGLLRIAGYAGKMRAPRDIEDGAELLKSLFGAQFPALAPRDWRDWAARSWTVRDGHLAPTYDAAVAASLAQLDPAQPLPALWNLFDALPDVPLMVLRGEHSDLLSEETVTQMLARRPRMASLVVAGQGHTPLLAEAATIAVLLDFVRRCDG